MGLKNQIHQDYTYFLTLTVVDWVDIFTRPIYKEVIINSLRFCQAEKGLELFAWVLMTNHLHMVASASEGKDLSDILRDFKKFTSKSISKLAQSEWESRRLWIVHRLEFNARYRKNKYFKVWQDGNEPQRRTVKRNSY